MFLIPALVFVGVLATIVGAYTIFVVRPERQIAGRLQPPQSVVREAGLAREDAMASTPLLHRLLERIKPFALPAKRFVDQSRLPMTTATFLLATGCLALGGYLLALFGFRTVWIALPVGLLAGAALPLYVSYVRTHRLRRMEEQLPDAVDLIARALRAGHALTTGLGMVAEELDAPIATEFRALYDEQNYGLSLQEAMHKFAERVPLLDARFFVTAVLTQREAGGNLAEVLDNLSSVMRERFRVKRQIRVISTHGRMTGWVLVLLPPALALGFFLITENHMQLLVNDPLGLRMIVAAIILQILGTLAIRRIINVEY